MNNSTDRRRYGVIEARFHQRATVALYTLSINGQTWAQVEWSPSRRAWCIQDSSGRCLAHCDAIHGQDVDAQAAVALARRMIIDGRMPTPEEARVQLAKRLATDAQVDEWLYQMDADDRHYESQRLIRAALDEDF